MKQLAIGTQTFANLRNNNAVYVDKTEDIYKLINSGNVYFLSRPRRFGKSLLISTLKELFKGSKELFEGLYIYDKWDWSKQYPVIRLDFTALAYDTPENLKRSLFEFVKTTARQHNIELQNTQIETMFAELIEKMHKSTGQQVVMLVDEYDKPVIDTLNKAKEVHQEIKETLHNFYQLLKGSDAHLKFVFMTGVSRFVGLSIFSAWNNLYDITMDSEFATICGYTQEELESNFKEHIESTTEYMGKSKEELLSKIKHWYNGYSWDGKTFVYNPFSTLKLFYSKEFHEYWFNTGTPTFLIEQIKKKDDLELFAEQQRVREEGLSGFAAEEVETSALLFQTGYLTIKKKEATEMEVSYTIGFPNFEVKTAFLTSLLGYMRKKEKKK
ncbi:MAG: AAA family ATPase [Endomicrobium sp.]|jgi:hypothetical protein|nr:AAA family ATPase [Endomicrobium sp.]